jgi:hypothetical protein
MEGGHMTEIIIVFCIIILIINVVSWIISINIKKKQRCFGKLVINMTNPLKDVYTIEMDDLRDLEKYKKVFLEVVIEDDAQK